MWSILTVIHNSTYYSKRIKKCANYTSMHILIIYWFNFGLLLTTVQYRKMPQFARLIFCEHVSFTDMSIIVIDFLCEQVSSYDVYRRLILDDQCVKMRMKDATLMCCIIRANTRTYSHILAHTRIYSHILAYNDNIMTNTKLHILAILTCAYMRIYAVCVILTVHLVRAK